MSDLKDDSTNPPEMNSTINKNGWLTMEGEILAGRLTHAEDLIRNLRDALAWELDEGDATKCKDPLIVEANKFLKGS